MNRLIVFLSFSLFLLDFHNVFSGASPIFGKDVMKATNFFKKDKYPFVASIGGNRGDPGRYHTCAGVLISRRHVLTSAHCKELIPSTIRVFLGSGILENGKQYESKSFVKYSEWASKFPSKDIFYTDDQNDDDIGIVTLTQDVDESIKHVSFTKKDPDTLYDQEVYVVSWSANKMPDDKIHKVVAPLRTITNQKMERKVEQLLKLNGKMQHDSRYISTVASGDVFLNCGDSGSPLLDDKSNLIAITSRFCLDQNDQYSQSNVNLHVLVHLYADFINAFLKSSY